MSGVLDKILASKRAEIASLGPPKTTAPRRFAVDVRASLRTKSALALILEIKKRSPSAGLLSTALSVGERACVYARGGAAMVSVLCDAPFFGGSWDDLAEARRALDTAGSSTPLLAKEFILEPAQLDHARANGADAALVIVRLAPERVRMLVEEALKRDLEPLVEVANEDELRVALDAGARMVGVNARDLDTLQMDAVRAARVRASIPDEVIAVHLSGLRRPEDVAELARARAHAALIGEALMREDDPTDLLKRMKAAADFYLPTTE